MDLHSNHSGESSTPAGGHRDLPLDVELLTRRMQAGDEDAYRTFHEAYFDRLWRYLLVVTAGNEDSTREALQAALIRVTRHIKVFRDEMAFWSWLTVLARSALIDQSRTRRRYFAFLERFTLHSRVQQGAADNGEADSRLQALLQEGLARLPTEDRHLMEQKYNCGRSVRELAAEFRTSEKAIESRLSRIRTRLREMMIERLKHE